MNNSLLNSNMVRCRGVLKHLLDIIDINVKNHRTIDCDKMKLILKAHGNEDDIFKEADDEYIPYIDLMYCDIHCKYYCITDMRSITFYGDEFVEKPQLNLNCNKINFKDFYECDFDADIGGKDKYNIQALKRTMYNNDRNTYYSYSNIESARYAAGILNMVAFAISYKDSFEFDDFDTSCELTFTIDEGTKNGETRFFVKEIPYISFDSIEKCSIFMNTLRKEFQDKK